MNSFSNGDNLHSWTPDAKYLLEFKAVIERVQSGLETGILTKYKMLRTRQLE